MNTTSKFRAANVLIVGLLAAFAGCASAPLHQSTSETNGATIPLSALSDNIQAPTPLKTVAPHYPDSMKRAGVNGVVHINCLVDEKGIVKEAKVTKTTDREFNEPALDALWKWVFTPAQRDGVAVPMRVNVPMRFTLAE